MHSTSVADFLTALQQQGIDYSNHGIEYRSQCPCCRTSRNDKLAISHGDDGRLLLRCFGGCDFKDIVSSVGHPSREHPVKPARCQEKPDRKEPKCHSTLDDAVRAAIWGASQRGEDAREGGRWVYLDASRKPIAAVVRLESDKGKTYRPLRRTADGKWQLKGPPRPRPLYQLPDVLESTDVWIVEGEKSVDAATRIGLVATTSMNGCGAARHTDWAACGRKQVTICPDSGPEGEKYLHEVYTQLMDLESPPLSIEVCRLGFDQPNLDVVDWLDARKGMSNDECRAELLRLCEPYVEPSAEDDGEVDETPSGTNPGESSLVAVAADWIASFQAGEKPIRYETGVGWECGPKKLVTLGGAPGSGKTTLAIQAVTDALLNDNSLRATILCIEMPNEDLLERQVALVSGVPYSIVRYRENMRDADEVRIIDAVEMLVDQIGDRLQFLNEPYDMVHLAASASDHGSNILLLDYLQRIRPDTNRPNADQRIDLERTISAAQALCKTEGMAVLAISSLNREKDVSQTRLKGSSELEYGCDSAYIMLRGEDDKIVLKNVKNRSRRLTDIELEQTADLRFRTPEIFAGWNEEVA